MTEADKDTTVAAIHDLDLRLTSLEVASDQREGASADRHKALTELIGQRFTDLAKMLGEREAYTTKEINRIWAVLGALGLLIAGAVVKSLIGG